jgi:hypothetical protein
MGRISGRENIKAMVKKYGGNGVDFFSLKDDGDSAKVRILHTDDQDLDLVLVHKVEVDGKERWVECIAEENNGVCPLCEKYGAPTLKLFIFLLDHADEKIKVWERGSTMIDFLIGFIDKYGYMNNRDYEIVRHGKKNDNKTSYQLFPEDKCEGKIIIKTNKGETEIELPKRPELFGRFVLQWNADEMSEYIDENEPVERARGERGKDKDKKKNGPGF